jgi:predicted nucleic acid-binding Zn ribbon protein
VARYEYICPQCEEVGELQHPMKEAVFVVHDGCFVPCERILTPGSLFQHTEDRRHMRGESVSHATGKPYAQSRREERVLEKAGGFEFITPAEMPEQWRTLRDHARYVKNGGTALAPDVLNPPPDPRVEPGTILRKMSQKGLRFGCR